MPRPKPDHETVQVLLRLHPAVIEAIDKLRGDASRAAWVSTAVSLDLKRRADEAVMAALREEERLALKQIAKAWTPGTVVRVAPDDGPGVVGLQYGPVRAEPGSRLKRGRGTKG